MLARSAGRLMGSKRVLVGSGGYRGKRGLVEMKGLLPP